MFTHWHIYRTLSYSPYLFTQSKWSKLPNLLPQDELSIVSSSWWAPTAAQVQLTLSKIISDHLPLPKGGDKTYLFYFKTKTFSLGALVTWFFNGSPFVLSEPMELHPLSTLCSQDSPTHSPSVACPHYEHWDDGREVVMLEQFDFWQSRVKEECHS